MPLGGVAAWQRRVLKQAPGGVLVALLVLLVCIRSLLRAAPPERPPTDDELLELPGPAAEEVAGDVSPFGLFQRLPENVRIGGDYEMYGRVLDDTLVHVWEGDVEIRTDTGLQAFADKVTFDGQNRLFRFEGDVSVYQGAILHRGESATYHYEEERLEAEGLRSGMDPLLLEAGKFRMEEHDGRQYFIGENAGVTTDDMQDPSFWARADETTVIAGDRVIFRNMKFYAGDTPIFWLPYLSQPLDRELGYHFVPGARSTWGPYLLNRYGIMLGGEENPVTGIREDAWLLSQWRLDLLARRGIGTGVDFFDTRLEDNQNLGWLKLYHIYDHDATLDRSGENRQDVDPSRYRAQLRHRLEFDDLIRGGDTWLDADATVLSDRHYLEDFDPGVFRVEPNPDNLLALTHVRDRNLITFWTRFRPNSFYQTDTRLPEIALDQVRHPLFGGPVLHEGQTLFGIYNEHLPDFQRHDLRAEAASLAPDDPRRAEIETMLSKHGFTRFHTWQEVSMPLVVDGWLNLVPRAGLGFTGYYAVDGDAGDQDRTHIFTGFDASVKFSKRFPGVQSESLGLDGLLHVVQPYATAAWFATDELDASFPRIDRLTASTRPRPLGVGRFTAIDDLEDWSVIRLGARNRFLTHRDGGTHEWLTIDSFFDWFIEDPEFDRTFSNFYNDVRFSPVPWVEVGLETQFPLLGREGDFTEVAAALRFMPVASTEIAIRHRFLDNHPILQNSTRLEYDVFHRFNEDWGAGFTHRWEFDDGTLELQRYALHRTLNNWAISLGLFHRDNRDDDEFGFVLGFTLKDFPSVNLPLKVDAE